MSKIHDLFSSLSYDNKALEKQRKKLEIMQNYDKRIVASGNQGE